MLRKVTVVSSLVFRKPILALLTMLPPCDCWIVSLTGTENTWTLPEFLTVTWKAVSALKLIVVREAPRSVPAGSTFTEISDVPHGQFLVPAEWPLRRCTTDVI